MTIPTTQLYDLIIIGSGPAALAVLARILEQRPAALYTEDEHAHLHWLHRRQQYGKRRMLQLKRSGRGHAKLVVDSKDEEGKGGDEEGEKAPMRILVIDRFGSWMANWNRLFAAYGITHLRSPLFFHIAPSDNDALRAFAERQAATTSSAVRGGDDGSIRVRQRRSARKEAAAERSAAAAEGASSLCQRLPDLLEVAGCVGKEIPKHKRKHAVSAGTAATQRLAPAVNERDRRDYYTPSAPLFKQFVEQDIVHRYALHANNAEDGQWLPLSKATPSASGITLARGIVCDLSWQTHMHVQGREKMDGFRVQVSDDGDENQTMLAAKAVVMAVGPGVSIGLPKCLQQSSETKTAPRQGPGWCHSTQLGLQGQTLRGILTAARPQRHTVLAVIGGGLSAAQICDLALRTEHGVSHVHLIMRTHVKSKPFDVGLEWMGRWANLEKMCFWQEEDAQVRLDKLRAARRGGSITPRYVKLLRQHEAQGRLTIHTCVEAEQACWTPAEGGIDENDGTWSLQLQKVAGATTAKPSAHARRQARRASEDTPPPDNASRTLAAHYLVAATGAAPSFSDVPFLRSFVEQSEHRVPEFGGLPFLTEDLQYGSLPLFCAGAFSALQIGPAAFNLEGMRAAADRIVIRLQELALREGGDDGGGGGDEAGDVVNINQEHPSLHHDVPYTSVSRYTHFAYQHLLRDVEA